MMTPQKKASSQTAASSAFSKGKKVVNGGTSSTDHPPQSPNIVLQSVEKEQSSPTITPERATNEHESQLSIAGQPLQVLARLQQRLDEQEAEVAREPRKPH